MNLRASSRRLINWIGGTFGTSVRSVLLLSLVISLIITTATTLLILDLRARDLNRAKETIDSLSRVLSDQTTRAFDSILLTMRSTRERLSDDIGNRLELDIADASRISRLLESAGDRVHAGDVAATGGKVGGDVAELLGGDGHLQRDDRLQKRGVGVVEGLAEGVRGGQ